MKHVVGSTIFVLIETIFRASVCDSGFSFSYMIDKLLETLGLLRISLSLRTRRVWALTSNLPVVVIISLVEKTGRHHFNTLTTKLGGGPYLAQQRQRRQN